MFAKQRLFSNNWIHICFLCPCRVLKVKWGLENTSFEKISIRKHPMSGQEKRDYFYKASIHSRPCCTGSLYDHHTDHSFSQMWQLRPGHMT